MEDWESSRVVYNPVYAFILVSLFSSSSTTNTLQQPTTSLPTTTYNLPKQLSSLPTTIKMKFSIAAAAAIVAVASAAPTDYSGVDFTKIQYPKGTGQGPNDIPKGYVLHNSIFCF